MAGDDQRIAAAVAAAKSDLIVAVVGERETMSGEAKNRAHLDLPGNQQALVDALVATGKPVVVVLLTGRALAVPGLVEQAGALRACFFPGIEGGHALADVLFGDYNPGGKEPVTWPRSVGQLPIHHYDPPNGRPNIPERGDYKAHWLDEPDEPLFAFGFGLSYSRFTLEALELPRSTWTARHADDARAPDQHVGSRRRRSAAALHTAARSPRGDRQATDGIPARASRRRVSRASSNSHCPRQLAVLDAKDRWTLKPGPTR